jgi:hypothetical protein
VLEGSAAHPVLIVRPARHEAAVEA